MTLKTSKLLNGAVVAAMALSPVAAFAQTADADTDATTMPAPAENADFSEAQLESFVEATIAMQDVRTSFVPRFESAEDDGARQELAQQANAQMVAVVEDAEGIDLDTYNQIGRAAQSDEELNSRLVAMVQQRVGTQPDAADQQNEG